MRVIVVYVVDFDSSVITGLQRALEVQQLVESRIPQIATVLFVSEPTANSLLLGKENLGLDSIGYVSNV